MENPKNQMEIITMSISEEKMLINNPLVYILNEKKGYLLIKKIMDKPIALIGLILFIPLFVVTALILKVTEPKAPVIFKQIRKGKNAKNFTIYKFRTMHLDAEKNLANLVEFNEIEGAMFKIKNDPRITKVGRFLRKSSIDEFPQLLNVLKGEMSLVGPRPPLPSEVQEYSKYDLQRLLVTPGCTGLWQVSGRNQLSFDEMVELDLEYIKRISMGLDLKIIFKTISVLLRSNNGY